LKYKQKVAFINRENELTDLITFIDKEPAEILFIHGPKSSGKTTLLYKFLDQTIYTLNRERNQTDFNHRRTPGTGQDLFK
jgi:AAA+ ATPase superfamily predicted ATPase